MTRFFPKSIAKTAIVTALSASLAFSPMTATPAKAGSDEAAAVAAASFFALVTAGIIASAARHNDGVVTIHRPGRHDRGHVQPDRRKILPAQCDFTVRRGPDRGTYYGRYCLRNNYNHVASLPARCLEKVWVPRRDRNVNAYDAQCLARFGYRERGQRSTRN